MEVAGRSLGEVSSRQSATGPVVFLAVDGVLANGAWPFVVGDAVFRSSTTMQRHLVSFFCFVFHPFASLRELCHILLLCRSGRSQLFDVDVHDPALVHFDGKDVSAM
jgi:hypothetical protein